MKNKVRAGFFFLILLTGQGAFAQAPEWGDRSYAVVEHFKYIADNLAQAVERADSKSLPFENFKTKFASVLASYEVTASPLVFLPIPGRPDTRRIVDALNYTDENGVHRIEVSLQRWRSMSNQQKVGLVLHEMLPGLGIKDRDYSNTVLLLNLLQPWFPEEELRLKTIGALMRDCDEDSQTLLDVLYSGDEENRQQYLNYAVSLECERAASQVTMMPLRYTAKE
ncbi:hypothetical protein AZI86_01690 [Bdellovibrio bacteriovorus]|uniref:Uncharacterized protein n=1 Tax=Bdellovibrio bacteriovorus TaxID=959 RepID=A0A150WMU4_BDEBC|nr:hypothetical protein [Bdellovibrio bacteriovorus]KYG65811.1 hypothetical protein AZI86_01690 [Bdellovibrio bacteriovorus]